VFSKTALTTGKYYYETTITSVTPITTSGNGTGVMPYTPGAFSDGGVAFNGGAGVVTGAGTTVFSNGASTGKVLGAQAVGDVICAALDLTARLAWFRRNGGNWNADAAANPDTGVGGVVIPAGAQAPCVRFTNQNATDAFTGNFGASVFAFTRPTTFASWDGWQAGRFKLSTVFTPAQRGFIYCRVKCAKPSSTFYVDPMVTLS
jgi:hypothetical protein